VAIVKEILPAAEALDRVVRQAAMPSSSTLAGIVTALYPNGAVAIGYGTSASGNGVAVGRRVHAGPGMVVVDLDWLRQVAAAKLEGDQQGG